LKDSQKIMLQKFSLFSSAWLFLFFSFSFSFPLSFGFLVFFSFLFSEVASIMIGVVLLLLVFWQKFIRFVNLFYWLAPTAWSWLSQWKYHPYWPLSYMLLLGLWTFMCLSLLFKWLYCFVFPLYLRVLFPLFPFCWYRSNLESLNLFMSPLSILLWLT